MSPAQTSCKDRDCRELYRDLIAARLTKRAGSSDFFSAGYVTYSAAQKQDVLGFQKN